MVMVKQSYRPATSMSSRVTPARPKAISPARLTDCPEAGNHGSSMVP
jgi:hypothetical protein